MSANWHAAGVATSPEHDPEKWTPVFRKDHAPPTNPEHHSIQSEAIAL
jgi:hypothetical protein